MAWSTSKKILIMGAVAWGTVGLILVAFVLFIGMQRQANAPVIDKKDSVEPKYELLSTFELYDGVFSISQYCKDGRYSYWNPDFPENLNLPQPYKCADGTKIVLRHDESGLIEGRWPPVEKELYLDDVILFPPKEHKMNDKDQVLVHFARPKDVTGHWDGGRVVSEVEHVRGIFDLESRTYRELEKYPNNNLLEWNDQGTRAAYKSDVIGWGCRNSFPLFGYDLIGDKMVKFTEDKAWPSKQCAETGHDEYHGCAYWDPYWSGDKLVAQMRDFCKGNQPSVVKTIE